MDTFPVAPELMQAFPLGALNLLVAVASTVAAQHGVEPARRLCAELANNDEVWTYIAVRHRRLNQGRTRLRCRCPRCPSVNRSPWPPIQATGQVTARTKRRPLLQR